VLYFFHCVFYSLKRVCLTWKQNFNVQTLYTNESTMEISIEWHRFNVITICLHFNDTWLEDECFRRNMSPHITWRLDAMLINCEDTKFSYCLHFLLFRLSLNFKLRAPNAVAILLNAFIFWNVFSAYPSLYSCRKICCRVFIRPFYVNN
jgi:hypothetical protein